MMLPLKCLAHRKCLLHVGCIYTGMCLKVAGLAPRFPELLSWAGTLSQIISGTAKCLPSSSKSQIKCKSPRTYSTQKGNKRGRADTYYGFPGGSDGKNLPVIQETQVQPLGQKDPLEKGMASHCSTLIWRIPWTEKPGGIQSTGSQRVRHD